MSRLSERKIILVVRSTRLMELEARFATKAQAEFYVTRLGGDFSDYEREDEIYRAAVETAQRALEEVGRVQLVQRSFLPNFLFGPEDLVVAIGQDGLVANTLKYLDGQPLVGVNPDPARWDGQLLPFRVPDLARVMRELLRDGRKLREVTMAEARLNTGLKLLAVNDLFLGMRTHASARYEIHWGEQREVHSSSGVIVSTGLGSTGWFQSLMTGAARIAAASGQAVTRKQPAQGAPRIQVPWEADYLHFTVREPFPSRTTGTALVFGRVTKDQPLVLESRMGENGVIFSDGIEQDFLEFNSGTRAEIAIAAKRGRLVV
jgi:NAD kinase